MTNGVEASKKISSGMDGLACVAMGTVCKPGVLQAFKLQINPNR